MVVKAEAPSPVTDEEGARSIIPIVVPPARLGGAFIYCPHVTAERVKKGRKLIIVNTECKFRTRTFRKYRRHWISRHFVPPEPSESIAKPPRIVIKTKAGPKYPVGDSRRRSRKDPA